MREGCCLARRRGAGLLCNHACRVPEAQPGPIRMFFAFFVAQEAVERAKAEAAKEAAEEGGEEGAEGGCRVLPFLPVGCLPATCHALRQAAPLLLVPASIATTPAGCQPG